MDWTILDDTEKLDDWIIAEDSVIESLARYTVNYIFCSAYMSVSRAYLRKLPLLERYRHVKLRMAPNRLSIDRT